MDNVDITYRIVKVTVPLADRNPTIIELDRARREVLSALNNWYYRDYVDSCDHFYNADHSECNSSTT